MTEQLTLYTSKTCPYAHRVELALNEAKIDFTRYEIDLQNKPKWYAPQVNPASKVPAVAFGGPRVSPDKPSPESEKIAESLILIEFVADLSNSLLPKDPVLRAKARFFMDAVSTKFGPAFSGAVLRGEPVENVLKAVEDIQDLLPQEGRGKYAIGDEFTLADISVAPFFARVDVILKNDFGLHAKGEAKKVYDTLQSDPKYARFRQYFADLKARESYQNTFDEQSAFEHYEQRYSAARAQKVVA